MARRISKFLCAMLVICMVVSMVPAAVFAASLSPYPSKLYLKPNANWLEADARFAAYYFGGNNTNGVWESMTDSDGDGIYEVPVPSTFESVIFCRMNPATTENNWDNKWNQTSDLALPTDGTDVYTITAGTWDNGGGTWSNSCGTVVAHTYVNGTCSVCGASQNCTHSSHNTSGNCTDCGTSVAHTYLSGVCTVCGGSDPAYIEEEWYLFGYINGTNYGEYDDAASTGYFRMYPTGDPYTFGKTFNVTEDSYIAVKNSTNTRWYMTDGWQGEVTSVTLYDSSTLGEDADKLYIPAGKVTVTLVVNGDGTMTLSYTVQQTAVCEHPSHDQNGYCTVCHYTVEHTYVNGTCSVCGLAESGSTGCSHSYTSEVTTPSGCLTDGVKTYTCSLCGDSYTEVIPYTGHSYNYGTCMNCGEADPNYSAPETIYYLFGIGGVAYNGYDHPFVDGKLTLDVAVTSYVWVVDNYGVSYKTDGWQGEVSSVTLMHESNVTGTPDKLMIPAGNVTLTLKDNGDGTFTLSYVLNSAPDASTTDYYLVGYINGANYGCDEDWENLGQYKFVSGSLTVTFAQDSYVFIKTGDNANWYMFESFVTTTSGTLYNTSTGTSEKMFVPAGVPVTFALMENTDGSLTLSYAEAGNVVTPTLTLKNPTLAFEDEILYNVYYTVSDMSSVVEMGMVTFATRDTNGTVANALEIIPGYVKNNDGSYTVHSNGVPAKMLSDALYFKAYAKLTDGTYVYTAIAGYHAVAYANTILNSSAASSQAKSLVVAMLNYGAAAQTSFSYKTDALMNASLTSAQKALVSAYSDSMVATVPSVSTTKAGSFVNNGGYSDVHPTVSFEGAFSINYYFTPKYTPASGITFYYWNLSDFNANSVLKTTNATGSVNMTSTDGSYTAAIEGIAAKAIDEPVFIAGVYTNGGTSYYTPVIGYSLGAYCKNLAANGNDFGAATAVYGYYAKAYFAS